MYQTDRERRASGASGASNGSDKNPIGKLLIFWNSLI